MNADEKAITQLRHELRVDHDRRKRIHSRTFWEKRLAIHRRTQPRIDAVQALLNDKHLVVELDGDFGSEGPTEWLTFTATNTAPWPDEAWFADMASKPLRNEGEVESYYVQPLLRHLGYAERELSLKHRLIINHGSQTKHYQADLVVFDDQDNDEALLVVEAKGPKIDLTVSAMSQGRSYAQWLNAPLYLVTNSRELRLFYNPPGLQPECIFQCQRETLEASWPELVHYLSKESVRELKDEIRDRLEDIVSPLPS